MSYNTYPETTQPTYAQWLEDQGGVEYLDYDPSAGVSRTAEGERTKVRDPAQYAMNLCVTTQLG